MDDKGIWLKRARRDPYSIVIYNLNPKIKRNQHQKALRDVFRPTKIDIRGGKFDSTGDRYCYALLKFETSQNREVWLSKYEDAKLGYVTESPRGTPFNCKKAVTPHGIMHELIAADLVNGTM